MGSGGAGGGTTSMIQPKEKERGILPLCTIYGSTNSSYLTRYTGKNGLEHALRVLTAAAFEIYDAIQQLDAKTSVIRNRWDDLLMANHRSRPVSIMIHPHGSITGGLTFSYIGADGNLHRLGTLTLDRDPNSGERIPYLEYLIPKIIAHLSRLSHVPKKRVRL